MKQELVQIHSFECLTAEILELTFISEYLSTHAQPGQFVNIRVDNNFPLLRRPFSIFNIDENKVSIVFNVIGTGTKVLARKRKGDTIDVVGPCGNDFLSLADDSFDTAVFVGGGIGIAPFPFLTKRYPAGKEIITYVGGRQKELIVEKGLKNAKIATDDGSMGFHGTVLELIKNDFSTNAPKNPRFFLCGPNRMMKVVAEFAKEIGATCYASLECDMACGIGLCQGCNIEMVTGDKKYRLVCKEGTIFETQSVKFS
ncbi:MAG: dihydroorotate dehydrogenase electron transfer subunit [Bacteriovoracaceae bacterium]|nr:dihydroorotate dehydrogenase electron transfer subunit [Bacteroidota bacterium]